MIIISVIAFVFLVILMHKSNCATVHPCPPKTPRVPKTPEALKTPEVGVEVEIPKTKKELRREQKRAEKAAKKQLE